MSSNPPPGTGSGGAGRRIDEAVERMETELRHLLAYVNEAVIPQVRAESISALRTAAGKLREMADRFERSGGPGAQGPLD